MDETGGIEEEAEEEEEEESGRSDYEVLVSDQGEDDRLDELLHIDSIGYVRAKKRIAAGVDRDQAPAKKQALEIKGEERGTQKGDARAPRST